MKKTVVNRLRRLRGQLGRLEKDMSGDVASCEEIITQFLAIKGAANAAFRAYVTSSLAQCSSADTKKMQQLITTLIQK